MFKNSSYVVFSLVLGLGANVYASSISDTQDDLIAWVETQKTISETKAEWAAEKVIVDDLIELLEVEKEKYEAGIEELADTGDATDAKRSELNDARDKLLSVNEKLEAFIPELEAKVRSLLTQLPAPLIEELDQLIRRLPEPDAKTRLPVSQRLLTVVGILNKVDKFNTGITIKSEIRNVGETSSEVTTLYFGLAGAYFANDTGTYAGTGVPGSDGWEWTTDATIGEDIAALIESYQGTKEAAFVELPAKAL